MGTARRRDIGIAIALAASLLSGCDPLGLDPVPQSESVSCDSLPSRDSSPEEARIAILIDVSRSTRAAVEEAAVPSYAKGLRDVVHNAVAAKARISIGSFGGGSGAVQWKVKDQATDARLNNPKRQEQQAASTKKCLISKIDEALATPPAQPGTDVLGAVRAASDWVNGGAGAKSIAVATDGLTTVGCTDLTRAKFDGEREIAGIVKVCLDRKEMEPGRLAEVDFSMIGVGRPGPDQPVASPEQLAWLAQLWGELCRAGNGKCRVSTEDPGREKGMSATSAWSPDTTVGFSTMWRFLVPAAALFNTDRSELRPDARAHLIGIAVAIRTIPDSRVEVAGHADSTGNSAHNQTLSERRAAAVSDFLVSNGVIRVSTRGYGDTRPLCTTTPPDEACLQMNRRVEITAVRL